MARETIVMSSTDGPTLVAAARASCIPAVNKITLPNSFFYPVRAFQITMSGRISCAVTTPGTARFDFNFGVGGINLVFDTLAMNLNTVAKVNVPWSLDVLLVCRAIGSAASTFFFPYSKFTSEAVVGSPLPTVGGNGVIIRPGTAPAVGLGMDNTVASIFDINFTQTVATGSMTVHNYQVDVLN